MAGGERNNRTAWSILAVQRSSPPGNTGVKYHRKPLLETLTSSADRMGGDCKEVAARSDLPNPTATVVWILTVKQQN